MPLKRPTKIVSKGGQVQVIRGKPTGNSNQQMEPEDLSQEIPRIDSTLNTIDQALSGLVEKTRRGCGCGD